MMYIKALRNRLALSEAALAKRAGVSRLTLRQIEAGRGNPTIQSLRQVAESLDRDLQVFVLAKDSPGLADDSTVAVSCRILQDGFESWPLHLMGFVDGFRKDWDVRRVIVPPVRELPIKLKALLASTTLALCDEAGLEPPSWASRTYFLEEPWFVSGVTSLRAMAIVESPVYFRKNNIFVHDNFLKRA